MEGERRQKGKEEERKGVREKRGEKEQRGERGEKRRGERGGERIREKRGIHKPSGLGLPHLEERRKALKRVWPTQGFTTWPVAPAGLELSSRAG